MYFSLPNALLLGFVTRIWAINIVDFDTCNIPYIIPRNFERFCDHSDEFLTDISITNEEGKYISSISPPTNVTSSAIRNKPNLWTHEPFCIESQEANNGFCVYTNARFANGRGISIVATPKEIINVIQAGIFKNYTEELENEAEGAERYQQMPVHGKGLGNVANSTFQRGEKLMTFTPILAFQDTMMQHVNYREQYLLQKIAVDRLPVRSRNMFHKLMGHWGGDPYHDRIHTNSFAAKLGTSDIYFWAVLPETSRFNHDCRPNAVYHFNENTLSHHVYAVRQILPGEELTISYLRPLVQQSDRKQRIKEQWGFECSCTHCSQTEALTVLSDHRLHLIYQLEQELEDLKPNRTGTPAKAKQLIDLYHQERLEGAVADAYMYAALEYSYLGDKANAQKWASRAIEGLELWRGVDHVYFHGMWRLFLNPEGHDSWRYFIDGKANLTNMYGGDGTEGILRNVD